MGKWIIIALVLPVALYVSYKGYRFIKHRMIKQEVGTQYLNKPAPDARGLDVNGNRFILRSQKGKNVIIVFWATWCRYCVKEIPEIMELKKALKGDSNVVIISSSLDGEVEKAKSFIEKRKINYRVLIDEKNPGYNSEFNKPFRVLHIPSIWVVNTEGIVIAQNLRHIEDAIGILKL